jgi:hypothetical protein
MMGALAAVMARRALRSTRASRNSRPRHVSRPPKPISGSAASSPPATWIRLGMPSILAAVTATRPQAPDQMACTRSKGDARCSAQIARTVRRRVWRAPML